MLHAVQHAAATNNHPICLLLTNSLKDLPTSRHQLLHRSLPEAARLLLPFPHWPTMNYDIYGRSFKNQIPIYMLIPLFQIYYVHYVHITMIMCKLSSKYFNFSFVVGREVSMSWSLYVFFPSHLLVFLFLFFHSKARGVICIRNHDSVYMQFLYSFLSRYFSWYF